MREIQSEEDIWQILDLLNPLLGYYCVESAMSYSTELWMQFRTNNQVYNHTPMHNLLGEYTVRTRITDWKIVQDNHTIVTSVEAYEDLEQKVLCLVGLRLFHIHIDYPFLGLTLEFDNNISLIVKPEPEEFYEYVVAYWDVFLPNHMFLEVGPDYVWDFRKSDYAE